MTKNLKKEQKRIEPTVSGEPSDIYIIEPDTVLMVEEVTESKEVGTINLAVPKVKVLKLDKDLPVAIGTFWSEKEKGFKVAVLRFDPETGASEILKTLGDNKTKQQIKNVFKIAAVKEGLV